MNIKDIHSLQKAVEAKSIFQTDLFRVVLIHIRKNEVLKEHITKTPAFLICLNGEASYEDENGQREVLTHGDFYEIKPMVKH